MAMDCQQTKPLIGVGLRHAHYSDVLAQSGPIDFVEVHAENFFAPGGATNAVLDEVAELYPISIHATMLGLGSASKIPEQQIQKLKRLVDRIDPLLLSDHACFAWSSLQGLPVHSGDLLPIMFNEENLKVMAENISYVQDLIGRELLVENLSAYITLPNSNMTEAEFHVELYQRSGNRMLLDLNNLVVNAINAEEENTLSSVTDYLEKIPKEMVGEIHLAGCTPALPGEPMIDDHSQPVAEIVWDVYRQALRRFGAIPTLIEWDTELPSWDVLVNEAVTARAIAKEELAHEFA